MDVSGAEIPLARKTSELFLQFAEPLLRDLDELKAVRGALQMARLAWNVALLAPEKREAVVNESLVLLASHPDDFAEAQKLFMELVERKLAFFSEVNRWIEDFQVIPDSSRRYHVRVLASLPQEEVSNPHKELAADE